MDGWNTRFLLGWPIFRAMLVSGRLPFFFYSFQHKKGDMDIKQKSLNQLPGESRW